ncbi:DEAH-box ATP-dependent RNA helicase prp22 [Lobulomyces angularis]|nr:DEAH-box ATP-dependent RNA helicase prp22 [Lobulomyces angularis]
MSQEQLPIFDFKNELISAIKEYPFLIVVGDTGSGKTTQLPQYCLEAFPESKIVVTQPRRIAAISAAKRVSEERNVTLGEEIGYGVRFEKCYTQKSMLTYMTDGLLLRELINDNELNSFDIYVLDEAHERSLDTDILFGLLKNSVKKKLSDDTESEKSKKLRIIVMSATLDAEKFSNFFDHCPIFSIPGRMFEVDILWQKNINMNTLKNSFLHRCVKTAFNIHTTENEGDILVFLTGKNEIEQACRQIMDLEREYDYSKIHNGYNGIMCYPIYSSLETFEQKNIFKLPPRGIRKIVFSTNIAQTSVTVPGIRFVVDSGFVKQKVYDPKNSMDTLLTVPISQSAATQRAGRAGRTETGKVFRLYGTEAFDKMDLDTSPEIQRCSLIGTVLSLLKMEIHNVLEFEFIDKPDEELIKSALKSLWVLGAVNDEGKLTEIGKMMAELPVSPFLARSLIASVTENCSFEMITIAAILSVEDIFLSPRTEEKKIQAEEIWNEEFAYPKSDHLTFLKIFLMWEEFSSSSRIRDDGKNWCKDHFLHCRSLRTAKNVRDQLFQIFERTLHLKITKCPIKIPKKRKTDSGEKRMRELDINEISASNLLNHLETDAILKSLCAGFWFNTAKKQKTKNYFHFYLNSRFDTKIKNILLKKDVLKNFQQALYIPKQSFTLKKILDDQQKLSQETFLIFQDLNFNMKPVMKNISLVDFKFIEKYFFELEKKLHSETDFNNISFLNFDEALTNKSEATEVEPSNIALEDSGMVNSVEENSIENENSEDASTQRSERVRLARERYLNRKKK